MGHIEKTQFVDPRKPDPKVISNFSPRDFEVFISFMLTKIGFSNVRLSRYCKDGGYDIYAIYFAGDQKYTVVVEVKHYTRTKAGLAIVDRLNGVRDREDADKGIIFTTSSFSADAKKYYDYKNSKIALIDFEKIAEILQCSNKHWSVTPSGLWYLKSKERATAVIKQQKR